MSEAQGGGLIRDQSPPNTTPARRESQRRYGGNTITEWSIYSIYDGLNKQPDLLGKINPKCVLSYIYPAQIGLFLTQCFLEYAEFFFIIVLREIKADGRKLHSIFCLILQKKFRIQ